LPAHSAAHNAPAHADDHDAIDAFEWRAVQADQLKITPLLRGEAEQRGNMPAPAGEFASDSPESTGNGEVISGSHSQCQQCWNGRPEAHQILGTKLGKGHF